MFIFLCRMLNCAFDHEMIFCNVVVHEPTKVDLNRYNIFFFEMNNINKMTQNKLNICVISFLQIYFICSNAHGIRLVFYIQ